MDIQTLDGLAVNYFAKGLANSTQRSYGSAQHRFLTFCSETGLQPVPASEKVLCYFVAHLANGNLKHRTIKCYLSAVRYLHIAEGFDDPFTPSLHRLQYTLQGIKRCEAEQGRGNRERLPISPDILRLIKAVWDAESSDPDKVMLWAACCIAFFGFLRAGELTVPGDDAYDPAVHLSYRDISVDNPDNPQVLRIVIKQSKTDPFRKGVNLYLGKTSTDLCPVTSLANYLIIRSTTDGPLFQFKDGRPLTRHRLVLAVREALQQAGFDQSRYCGHSFRIGAATTAAKKGMEDSVIKTLGRWNSVAYLQYVKIPREQLASFSNLLCS